jgi:hypothetical protein
MGSGHSEWMGGWRLAIPRGPSPPEEASAFVQWPCANEEAGRSMTGALRRHAGTPAGWTEASEQPKALPGEEWRLTYGRAWFTVWIRV